MRFFRRKAKEDRLPDFDWALRNADAMTKVRHALDLWKKNFPGFNYNYSEGKFILFFQC
jgi:hypothetical protein